MYVSLIQSFGSLNRTKSKSKGEFRLWEFLSWNIGLLCSEWNLYHQFWFSGLWAWIKYVHQLSWIFSKSWDLSAFSVCEPIPYNKSQSLSLSLYTHTYRYIYIYVYTEYAEMQVWGLELEQLSCNIMWKEHVEKVYILLHRRCTYSNKGERPAFLTLMGLPCQTRTTYIDIYMAEK